MLPAPANAIFADRSAAETPGEVLDAFVSHLARTGAGTEHDAGGNLFLCRWPDVTAWARNDHPPVGGDGRDPVVPELPGRDRTGAPLMGLPGAPQVLLPVAGPAGAP